MAKHRLSVPVEASIQAAAESDKPGTITMEAYNGGLLRLRYWDYPIVCDCAGIKAAAPLIPIRIGHGYDDLDDVLGQGSVAVEANRVTLSGSITGVSERAQQVIAMAKRGHKFQASIGGDPREQEFIPEGTSVRCNGQSFDGPLYYVKTTELTEISVVALGADTSTSVSIAASAANGAPTMEPKFSTWVEAKGFDPTALTETAKTYLQAEYDKECKAEAETEKEKKKEEEEKAEAARKDASIQANAPPDPMKARAEAYTRMASIEAKLAGYPALCAQALKENWSDDKCDLELLRAKRPDNNGSAPAMHIHGQHTDVGKAIEASCLIAGGVNPDRLVKKYGEANVEAANSDFRGLGIRDIFRICARQFHGVELPMHSGNGSEFIRAALQIIDGHHAPIQAAGNATPMSLPGILSNVAHKLLLDGYNSVEQSWRPISKQGSLQDFKPHNRFRLTNDFRFKPLNTAGELQHGQLGEQAYQITGDTQGIIFNLDRKLIINDDMSAFSTIPKAVGRGAGLAINNDFWTLWLSNPAYTTAYGGTASGNFFAAGSNNYLSGTTVGTNDSRLNVEGLSRAYTKQLQQTDPAGYPMGIEPSILLVPASLRYTAESLMISRILVSSVSTGATNNNLQPSENPLAGKFKVVASAYLDNSSFTGYSATAWYLLLDPEAGFPCIEAAFLNGQQQPLVERAEADFSTLGIRFRSWIDFGLALEEPRGGVMSAGA